MIKKYNQTLVMITHDETIAQMSDIVVYIEDGKVVKGGVINVIFSEYSIDSKYQNNYIE